MTETPNAVIVFELKLDKTAEIALTQAESMKYRERFAKSDKNTIVLGVNFSSKTHNIEGWKGKVYSAEGKFLQDLS